MEANHQVNTGAKMHQEIPDKIDALARLVVDAEIKVHKALGPGCLESAYQACLKIELERPCVRFILQNVLPICYEGNTIEGAYRIELLVDEQLTVGLKAVDQLLPIHSAQLVTCIVNTSRCG